MDEDTEGIGTLLVKDAGSRSGHLGLY